MAVSQGKVGEISTHFGDEICVCSLTPARASAIGSTLDVVLARINDKVAEYCETIELVLFLFFATKSPTLTVVDDTRVAVALCHLNSRVGLVHEMVALAVLAIGALHVASTLNEGCRRLAAIVRVRREVWAEIIFHDVAGVVHGQSQERRCSECGHHGEIEQRGQHADLYGWLGDVWRACKVRIG